MLQQRSHCYASCLIRKHAHLLIETPEWHLVSGMHREVPAVQKDPLRPTPEEVLQQVSAVYGVARQALPHVVRLAPPGEVAAAAKEGVWYTTMFHPDAVTRSPWRRAISTTALASSSSH